MSNLIELFNFKGHQVRTLKIDDEPWFVGKDVADILGYKNGSRDINLHVDSEDKLKYKISTSGQMREQTLINESGLYSLILASKMPNAKKFKHWVTSEVLPSIRRHGTYMTPDTIERVLTDPDTIIKIATQLKDERQKRIKAQEKVKQLTPSAEYTKKVLSSKDVHKMTGFAKNYGLSAQVMNRGLHKLHVLYKQGRDWYVYQDAKHPERESWSFQITTAYKHRNGEIGTRPSIRYTEAGFKGLHDLLAENGILTTRERNPEDYKTFDSKGNIVRVYSQVLEG